ITGCPVAVTITYPLDTITGIAEDMVLQGKASMRARRRRGGVCARRADPPGTPSGDHRVRPGVQHSDQPHARGT
ncbi:hypothetical protein D9B85_13095, partial [Corynebacterium diphtheriae]